MDLNQLVLELRYEDKVGKEIIEALQKDILKKVQEINGLNFQVVEGNIGWSRDWAKVLNVYRKEDPKNIIGKYLLKPPHSISEVNNSIWAFKYKLGPEVMYAKENAIIIEEYFPEEWDWRTRQLSKDDRIKLSIVMAEKVQIMLDNNFGHYENFHQHTFIIGEGDELDIRFVDWARVTRFYIEDKLEPVFVSPIINFTYQILGESEEVISSFKDKLLLLGNKDQRRVYVQIIK